MVMLPVITAHQPKRQTTGGETDSSLTGTIDNIINSELAREREESTIEDEA